MPEQRITDQRLKPCPNVCCKSDPRMLHNKARAGYVVLCRACGWSASELKERKEDAISLWNERPGDAVTLESFEIKWTGDRYRVSIPGYSGGKVYRAEDVDAVIEQAQKVADTLIAAHSDAYRKADLARNEDAMSFIAGLRDGATGVRDAIFAVLMPPKEPKS